jgi:hypothetical protein
LLNGQEVGPRSAENRSVSWPVTLREGENEIEVRAKEGEEMLSDKVTWTYRKAPAMLGAETTSEE